MSEERLEKLLNKMYYDYLEREEAQEVINYIKKLEKENKMLRDYGEKVGEIRNQLYDKIDKALEYIEEVFDGEVFTHTFDKCNMRELFEILRGEENDQR